MALASAALLLKQQRVLAEACAEEQNVARDALSHCLEKLQRVSRQHRNLQHALHVLFSQTSARVRVPCALGACPDPSVPPLALRRHLGNYGALLTALRGMPTLVAWLLHRAAAVTDGGPAGAHAHVASVHLLLCILYGHLWRRAEERALLRVAGQLVALRVADSGSSAALRVGALPERLLSAYLRVMPGGAAWLQAAVGTQIGRVARRSAAGARLLVDAMDAYVALPAEEAAEVDNDVARGDLAALGEHHRVVAALSARGAELCAACEALLEDVLRAAPAAPAGVCVVVVELQRAVPPAAAAAALLHELLLGGYVAPAVECPEAYGILLNEALGGDARADLRALALATLYLAGGGIECSSDGSACMGSGSSTRSAGVQPSARATWLARECTAALLRAAAVHVGGACADDGPSASGASVEPQDAPDEPPLPLEIPLYQLRAVHMLCDPLPSPAEVAGAPKELLRAISETAEVPAAVATVDGEDVAPSALLGPIIAALRPAVGVLADVGITWGDESVTLDVGPHALQDFVRRSRNQAAAAAAASSAPDADAASTPTAYPVATPAVVTLAVRPPEDSSLALERKLWMLMQRMPARALRLSAVHVATTADAPATWRALPTLLELAARDAAVAGNDSLLSQIREVLSDLRAAVGTAVVAENSSLPENLALSLGAAAEAEGSRLGERVERQRREWETLSVQAERAASQLQALWWSTVRLRRVHKHAREPAVVTDTSGDGRGSGGRVPLAPPSAARLALQQVLEFSSWRSLPARERVELLCSMAGHVAADPPTSHAPDSGAAFSDVLGPLVDAEVDARELLHACAPAVRELLRIACAAPLAEHKALLLGELSTTLRAAFHSTLSPAATLTDRACAWLLLQHTPHRVANCIDVAASLLAQCDAIPGGDEARAVLQFGRAVELLPPLLTQAAVLSETAVKNDACSVADEGATERISDHGHWCLIRLQWVRRQAEATALRRTRARLCGVCVRLHVHGLVEWVHAQSLQRLVEGFSPGEATIRTSARQLELSGVWADSAVPVRHPQHLAVAQLLARLRAEPALVCTALDRSGVFSPHCPAQLQEACVQLVLCSLHGDHAATDGNLLRLTEVLCARFIADPPTKASPPARAEAPPPTDAPGGTAAPSSAAFRERDMAGAESSFAGQGLLGRLLSAYLRVMPGGAAWLQAAVGTQIGQVARRSAAGARLLVDAMDAYMALPAEEAAEVDNDVARGDLVALGEHHRVVAALSARGAELCAACEALLEDVLRAAPAAPGALRRLARCLLPPASSAAPPPHVHVRAPTELLFTQLILPAVRTPEAYGLQLSETLSATTRANLRALAFGVEQLILGDVPGANTSPHNMCYFTPQLFSLGTTAAASLAAALASADLPSPSMMFATLPAAIAASADECIGTADGAGVTDDHDTASVVIDDRTLRGLLALIRRALPLELPLPAALAAWASVPSAATTADGGAPNGDMPLVGPVQVLLDAIGGASDPPQFYTFFLAPTVAAAAAGEDGDEHEDGDVANGNHAGLDGAAAALWAFVQSRAPVEWPALSPAVCASAVVLRTAALAEQDWQLAIQSELLRRALSNTASGGVGVGGGVGGGGGTLDDGGGSGGSDGGADSASAGCSSDGGSSRGGSGRRQASHRSSAGEAVAQLAAWAAADNAVSMMRGRRTRLLLATGEAKRAAEALERRTKLALRQIYALAAEAQIDTIAPESTEARSKLGAVSAAVLSGWLRLDASPADVAEDSGGNAANGDAADMFFPKPVCYCHPPALAVCRLCAERKARLDEVVDELTAVAESGADDGAADSPAMRHLSSSRQLSYRVQTVLRDASAAYGSVFDCNVGSLRASLLRGAVHTATLRRVQGGLLDATSADGQDRRLLECARALALLPVSEVGLPSAVASLCTSDHSFGDAIAALRRLDTTVGGPQAKLRCVLTAWDCVLGVLALCVDGVSADEFLPAMAHALIRARVRTLASAAAQLVNWSAREDFEEMWLFHFVAAIELMAQLSPPAAANGSAPPAAANGRAASAAEGRAAPDGVPPPLPSPRRWVDISLLEPQTLSPDAPLAGTSAPGVPEAADDPVARPGLSSAIMRRSWGSPFGDSTGDRMLLPAGLHHAFTHARSRAPHTATREVDASACHATLTDMGYTAEDAALGAQLFGRELPAAVSFLSQLHRLLEMGFDRPAVEAALQKSRDPEDVLQLLLGGASTPSGATSPAPLQSSALPAPPAQPAPPAPQRLDAATIAELTARRAALKAQLEASMLLAQPSPADTERYAAALVDYKSVSAALAADGPSQQMPPRSPAPQQTPRQQTPPSPAASKHGGFVCACPSCNRQLRVAAAASGGGATYQCPSCNQRFTVGGPPPPPPSPPHPSPHLDLELQPPLPQQPSGSLPQHEVSAPNAPKVVSCPACRRLLRIAAADGGAIHECPACRARFRSA